MSVNFYLNREQMSKEVEQCIALNRLETLMSFCNSCVLKIFENRLIPECHECKVGRGIKTVSKKRKVRNVESVEVEDGELLGVC